MATNDPYELEMLTSVNGIICRNVFHFIAKMPAADASVVVQSFKDNFLPVHQHVFSAYAQYVSLRAWLLNDPVADSFSDFIDGTAGLHTALPIDPRICVYASLRGRPEKAQHSAGGIFLSGVPSDWAQTPPKIDVSVQHAYQQVIDDWIAFFGADAGLAPLRWGILSRTIRRAPNMTVNDYFFPIWRGSVRPYFSMLKTRRIHPPF
jgi:hypothetical protein